MIRLAIPNLDDEDFEAVRAVLASGYLVQGPRVEELEQALARYIGVSHAVAVSNGTAALHLALTALEVRAGDLVLVTTYSWPATANVIELCGAHPVFVDIEPDTYNMDPNALGKVLDRLMKQPATAGRVRAILPVHTFGQVADMPRLLEIAGGYEIPIIEDAACALGARWNQKQAGTWGLMGCFSFHPRKNITTGEGGLIVTGDPKVAHRLRALRNHGLDPEASAVDFILPGFNYRMTEFQAALGLTQLGKLDRILQSRRHRAHHYDCLLQSKGLRAPVIRPEAHSVYQSYVLQLPDRAVDRRPALIKQLKSEGVETTLGTWHMPLTTYFRTRYGYRPGDFPITDRVFQQALTLPLHDKLQQHEQEYIVAQLVSFLDQLPGESCSCAELPKATDSLIPGSSPSLAKAS